MGEPRPRSRPGRRVTLTEDAELLGMSRDAVRMRVRRGSLASEKGADGRVYVFVDSDQDTVHPQAEDQGSRPRGRQAADPLVEELRDRVQFLERELERKDAILLNMTEAMKALNPPASQEPPEAPLSAEEVAEGPAPTDAGARPSSASQRPWWRRIFGEGG